MAQITLLIQVYLNNNLENKEINILALILILLCCGRNPELSPKNNSYLWIEIISPQESRNILSVGEGLMQHW